MSFSEEYKPIAAMVFVQAIFASVVLLLKLSLNRGMSPMVFILYRHIVASLSLAPVAYMIHRRSTEVINVGKKDLCLVFFAALAGVTANQSLYLTGLHLGSSPLATAMGNLVPAVTFLMAASVGMEKVDIRSFRSMAKVIGTAICIGGAVSMAFFKGKKLFLLQASVSKNWLMACLSFMGSNICWSVWLILQVSLCRIFPEPLIMSFWMCSFAALQSLVLTPYLERNRTAWRFSSNLELFTCIYAGIAGSATAYCIQAWTISRKGPLFSALFNPLCTVMTTMLAAVVTHEDLYLGSLIGAAAVVAGLYVVLWGKAGDAIDGLDAKTCVMVASSGEADVEEPLLAREIICCEVFGQSTCPN